MGELSLIDIEKNFIDDRNKELWKKLNGVFQIRVSNHHSVFKIDFLTGSEEVFIETTRDNSPSLFTHELLHLNLRYKGLNLFECFKRTNEYSIEIFTSTISNCIEHVLFFNEFIEMGFNKEDFIMDYNNHPFGISRLQQQFNQLYNTNDPELRALFISFCYWILKSGEYIGEDRKRDLELLKVEAPQRFQEMEYMFLEVLDFKFNSNNIQEDFNKLVSKYINYSSYY